jgi:riboflavin kinase/FMN adenylyltransferase
VESKRVVFAFMRGSTALLIGNFDGLHLGHRELVRTARGQVGPDGRVLALVFEPHPAQVLRPESVPPRLTTADGRRSLLVQAGVDEVIEMAPTPERLGQSPEEFIAWLVDEFSPSFVVEGSDFRFGRNREGTIDRLHELGRASGFDVVVVDPVTVDVPGTGAVEVHSGRIREQLLSGRVHDAAVLLGRPWSLHGTVVQGDQRGRDLDMPTANLDHGVVMLPRDGIYAGMATLPDGGTRMGAISVGVKPTFDEVPRVCEVHLLDHDGALDDYGWTLEIRFEHWLREQVAYDSVAALQEQLQQDLAAVRRCLGGGESPDAT